jgi:hypothetical protein
MPSTRSRQGKRKRENIQLPAPGTMNWGVRRKASVVIGIRNGVITREEACKRYMLSIEELAEWEAGFNEYGMPGLLIKTAKRRRRERARQS